MADSENNRKVLIIGGIIAAVILIGGYVVYRPSEPARVVAVPRPVAPATDEQPVDETTDGSDSAASGQNNQRLSSNEEPTSEGLEEDPADPKKTGRKSTRKPRKPVASTSDEPEVQEETAMERPKPSSKIDGG